MSDRARRLLAGFDRRYAEAKPAGDPSERELAVTMVEVLRDERIRRGQPGWCPRPQRLEELARERLGG